MIPNWLLLKQPTGNAILTYCHLARFGTLDHEIGEWTDIFPSMSLLQERTGLAENTLRRCLSELEDLGALTRETRARDNGSQTTNRYRLFFGTLAPPPQQLVPTPPQPMTPPPSSNLAPPEREPLTHNHQEELPPPASRVPPQGKATKGARLPSDFMPTEAMRAWFVGEGFHQILGSEGSRREHESFVDYWISKPGAAGVKLDWVATWRNWMRKAASRAPRQTVGSRMTSQDRFQQTLAAGASLAQRDAERAAQGLPPVSFEELLAEKMRAQTATQPTLELIS